MYDPGNENKSEDHALSETIRMNDIRLRNSSGQLPRSGWMVRLPCGCLAQAELPPERQVLYAVAARSHHQNGYSGRQVILAIFVMHRLSFRHYRRAIEQCLHRMAAGIATEILPSA